MFSLSKESLKIWICCVGILVYPVLFYTLDHDVKNLEFLTRTLVLYFVGVTAAILYGYGKPMGKYLAEVREDKGARIFLLIVGMLSMFTALYMLVVETS